MQRGFQTRLCVLILGGILLISCSPAGGTPMAGPTTAISNSTASLETFPTSVLTNTEPPSSISCENVSIGNPAAAYCALLGYQPGTLDSADGQVGVCTMPDGSVCEAWQFLRGTCGQEFSWCALNGYEIQTVIESDGSSTQEYAVCVDANGNTVGAVIELSGLQAVFEACSRR